MIFDVAWLWAGVAIVLYSVGVNVALIIPGDNPMPTPIWVAAVVGAFPVFGAGIILFRRSMRRRIPSRRPQTPATLPRSAYYILGLTCFAMVAVLVLNIATSIGPVPPGQPQQVGPTQFVLNNHGVTTPITHEEYLRFEESGQRGVVGISLIFCIVGILMLAASAHDWLPQRPRSSTTRPTP